MDAADAKMAEVKNPRIEASVSAAPFCKNHCQVQKYLVASLRKARMFSRRAAAMKKVRNDLTAKFEKLDSSMELRVILLTKIESLDGEAVEITQE